MLKLVVAGLIIFLVYSNPTFRTYTLETLHSITNLIEDLPRPETES